MMPFTILMSVYNGEKSTNLNDCFKSLESQTRMAEQLVLVEDGPLSSELNEVIDRYRKVLKINSIKLPVNIGLAGALNEGLKYCAHNFVARMDSDDIARPDRFEKQLSFLEVNPHVSIIGSAVKIFEQKIDNIIGERCVPSENDEIYRLLWTCPINHPTVVFKRDEIVSIGGYSSILRRRQDYELWFRCAQNGLKFHNLQSCLLYWRSPAFKSKNSFRDNVDQLLVGLRGAKLLRLPSVAYLGVFYPFLLWFFPLNMQKKIRNKFEAFNPRNNWRP